MYKEEKTQRGITLIALVITIIVMLILVGVTISMAVNGGLFNYAGNAAGETKNAINAEQELANGGIEVDGQWHNSIDEYLETKNGGEKVETISKTESYVGYYADVDGDGTVDGVIYADLLYPTEDGEYYGYSYTYGEEVVTVEEVKDYYVSKTNYEGDFGTKDVLTPTGDGEDRFYVMALEDFTEDGRYYCWYYSAYDNENTEMVTADGFGTGKANTEVMIKKWNASAFGEQNGHDTYKDIWGAIQILASKGWFVPSRDEWLAFADAFDLTSEWTENGDWAYPYGLSSYYWLSSQAGTDDAYCLEFTLDFFTSYDASFPACVRFSATF